MAKEFNKVVARDLKEYKKREIYFLHMVDMATRFSKSKSKEPEEIRIIEARSGTGLGAPLIFCLFV